MTHIPAEDGDLVPLVWSRVQPLEWRPTQLLTNTQLEMAARIAAALCGCAEQLPGNPAFPLDILRALAADGTARIEPGLVSRLVVVGGTLWRYNPEIGVWEAIPRHALERMAFAFDRIQCTSATQNKLVQLHMTDLVARNAVNTLMATLKAEDDFFDVGACAVYGSEVALVEGQKVRLEDVGVDDVGNVSPGVARVQRERKCRAHFTFRLPLSAGRFGGIGPGYHHSSLSPVWAGCMPTFIGHLRKMWGHHGTKTLAQYADVLRVWLGYSLLGRAPQCQQAIYLQGGWKGGNGKSMLLLMLERAVGQFASCDPATWQMDFQRSGLAQGQLFNILHDVPAWDEQCAGWAKLGIEGKPIEARMIGSQPFSYRPRAGWIIGSNVSQGGVGGLNRKLAVLECDGVTDGEGRRTEGDIMADIDREIPYIHAWALSGAEMGLRCLHGLLPQPAATREAQVVALNESHPFLEWAHYHCTVNAAARISTVQLLDTYRLTGARNVPTVSQGDRLLKTAFADQFKRHGSKYVWTLEVKPSLQRF